jgi:uncharacterized protein
LTDAMETLSNGPVDARTTLILAHGAGAPMDTPFMETVAGGIAAVDIRVLRFEFPYMIRRREDGKRRPPDRQPVLLDSWRSIIASVRSDRIAIGGKSMGGRMASLIADEADATALICLGYPFHPPGKPDRLRTEHLLTMTTPTLIVQGERDPFGTRSEVAGYPLAKSIQLHWAQDGNHDLAPRGKSGRTVEQNLSDAIAGIVDFLTV